MASLNFFKNQIFSLIITIVFTLAAVQANAAVIDYQTTIIVSPTGLSEVDNGQVLLNSLNDIVFGGTPPSVTSPFLLKLEPGAYDIGSVSLRLPAFVDMEGSGEGVTLVRGNAGDALPADQGVITVDANAALRQLTVESYYDEDFGDSAAVLLLSGARASNLTAVSFGSSPASRALMTGPGESGQSFATDVTAVAKTRAVHTFSPGLEAENLTANGVEALFVSSGEVSIRNSRLTGSEVGLLASIISPGVTLVSTELSGPVFCKFSSCKCLFSYTEALKPVGPSCLTKGGKNQR